MKSLIPFVVLILASFCMSGCDTVSEGIIFQKEFIPAHDVPQITTQLIPIGDSFITIITNIPLHFDDNYILHYNKACIMRGGLMYNIPCRVSVPKSVYELAKVGQYIIVKNNGVNGFEVKISDKKPMEY